MHDFPQPPSLAAHPPNASAYETFLHIGNMLKAFIGLNIMYTAYAFSKAGIVRGVIGLVIITVVTEHCCMLLIHVKNAMPISLGGSQPDTDLDAELQSEKVGASEQGAKVLTYGDIARHVGGTRAERLVNAALVLTQFGYCVGYLIFLAQTIHDIARANIAPWPFVLAPIPVLVALAMLESIRSLGPFSIAANGCFLIGFVAVVGYIGKHFQWSPGELHISGLALFFGQMTAALEGIGLVLPIENSMADKSKFPFVLRVALFTLTFVLMVVGVLGSATFGNHTRSIILLNFPDDSALVLGVKLVLVFGILLTYPLQVTPVFEFLESMLPTPEEEEAEEVESDDTTPLSPSGSDQISQEAMWVTDVRRITVRIAVLFGTAVVAMVAGASFGLFQSLVGSLGAAVLAYIAPAMLHSATFGDSMSGWRKGKNIFIVVFGILGMIFGTGTAIWEIVLVHRGVSKPV